MGTRSSRLQEQTAPSAFEKDAFKRGSCRQMRSARPTSLMVDFSGSFDHDSEANRSRSEEGSDSDTGPQASADGSPSDRHISPPLTGQNTPAEELAGGRDDGDGGPAAPVNGDRLSAEEPGRVPHRTLSDRLPGGSRHAPGRGVTARSTRARGAHPRPVSEAYIGLCRISRTGSMRCPFCLKMFPNTRIEEHLLSCLTSPPLPYNADVLAKDIGECSICLEDLMQGETIARLACLCVYHKSCIDSWSKVKPCCPEHPFD
ncbi:E3 ubiquitin-protein ligase znrf2 [Denticeps clupeoides]|uniref:E3 ubiquitin-protein ligase ZNRF1 n=1 Tax=Denticeps clupeoides TaxID=299321 RepID=A0AAY4B092_9TELE|nr:E3 ubiquitin-protein ligase znrf2-like [Denticeps clupeoides]